MLSVKELQYHIRGCTQNNRESQKKIYDNFYSYAQVICQHYAAKDGDVTEILNDGFLEAFIKIYQYKPSTNVESSFKAWLRKIMICTAIDYGWKNNKYKIMSGLMEKNARILNAREIFFDKSSYPHIKAFVKSLTQHCRTVFTLFVMEGFNHEEIAWELNISIGNSKSNLAKTRRQLEKILLRKKNTHCNNYQIL